MRAAISVLTSLRIKTPLKNEPAAETPNDEVEGRAAFGASPLECRVRPHGNAFEECD